MTNGQTNPLTDSDFQRIEEGLRMADSAIAQAEMAQRAGLDTREALKRAQQSKDQLLKIKQTYFPNR
jgi:hypothetical protein